jgi:hypothetical protein
LLTAIDHLQLAPEALAIDAAESSALLADVNRHLAGRGFALHEPGTGGEWLLECAEPIDCTCVEPEGATGRNLRDLMPGGRDGPRIRALINEMQMLLHEHPVNAGRAARGAPAVNSVWLWGFGGVGDVPALPLPVLYTDDPWLEGMWRLHGAPSRTLVEFAADVTRADRSVLLGWSRDPAGAAAVALAAAESRCFAPVRTALQGSAIEAVAMLLGDRAIVTDRSARVRFWRRPQPLQEALW